MKDYSAFKTNIHDNQEVEIVKSYKYLGTLLDESWSFFGHVDYV